MAGGPFDDPASPDDDTTVAGFDGTSSYVALPAAQIPATGPNSVAMWFKTPPGFDDGGTLYGFQTNPVAGGSSSSGNWVPALYVGADGKLRGTYCWCSGSTPTTSTTLVNDGDWHHVALAASTTSQTMYLDGVAVGSLNLAIEATTAQFAHVGAGETQGWPARPTNSRGHFDGEIAEVSFYHRQLSAGQVAAQFGARASSSGAAVKTVTVTDPGAHPSAYVHDVATGRKIAEVDTLGNTTQYGYDTGGFPRTVTDPNGNVTTTEQDVRGNTVSSKTCQDQAAQQCSTVFYTYFPDATTKVLTPDARNDVMLTVRDGRSASASDDTYKTTFGYDGAGNRTSVTDALGRVTATAHTDGATVAAFDGGFAPAGLPSTVSTAGGAAQSVVYYRSGDVATVTDPAGKVTSFGYDGLGRALTRVETTGAFPAGLSASFVYDPLGRVVSQTNPPVTNRVTGATHTAVTTTVYDVDGLVTSRTVTDATGGDAPRTVSWTCNTYGQRVASTDPAGETTTVEHDSYGRVAREIGADGGVVDYVFDSEGQLLTTTLADFTGDPNDPSPAADLLVTSRSYDPAGRLASVTDAMGGRASTATPTSSSPTSTR